MTKNELVKDTHESLKFLVPSLTFKEDGRTVLKQLQITLEVLNYELGIKQPRKLKKQYKRTLIIMNRTLNKITREWK